MRQRQRTSRTTPGLTTAAAAAAANAALDDAHGQHIVHPAVVRNKIPFKKKVREKDAGKRTRAGKSAGHGAGGGGAHSKALAVFRKPMRSKRHRSAADHERRRRSGVVNTKDKVRSWLERENPTHETIDSDNESHFPEEEVPDTRRQSAPNEAISRPEKVSDGADVRKRTNGELAVVGGAAKMMRSTSETPRDRSHQLHFSRSISHGHEPDFRRLSRKTESHSHLLSKSELELDDKTKDEADPAIQRTDPVTHPPVEKHMPIVSGKIHKSATDGHLTKPASAPASSSAAAKSKFQSFEFLSLLNGRKASDKTERKASRTGQDEAVKARKKIGIGPVKVVLKWHGASRTKPKRPANKPGAGKDDKAARQKGAKKKRVIVYKNGDPTAGATYVQQAKEPTALVQDVDKKPATNITSNPLDSVCDPGGKTGSAVLRSRRYSMQERQAPPTLMRHVSEIASAPPMNDNRRRNRHSWTVGNAAPDIPHVNLSSPEINIDMDDGDIC